MKNFPPVSSFLVLAAALCLTAACENQSYDQQMYGSNWNAPTSSFSPSYMQFSALAPPPPPNIFEPKPVLNNPPAQIWRPGYWDYSSGSYQWVPGEIIARPQATAVWSPDHWEKHTYGWAFIPGYWQ
jgi:hypothetical protein